VLDPLNDAAGRAAQLEALCPNARAVLLQVRGRSAAGWVVAERVHRPLFRLFTPPSLHSKLLTLTWLRPDQQHSHSH
jgi:hypothetical protein